MTLLNKVVGIFTGDNGKGEQAINTPEQHNLVNVVQMDFQYFKSSRQKIEGTWRQEQRFYMGNHWYGLRPEEVSKLRPNSVDNIVWSQVESIVSKLTGWVPQPDFQAQEPHDEQKAQELNEFMPYEIRKIKFHQKHIRAVRRMVIHGPLIYKTIYDPTVEGGFGQNKYNGNNDIIPVDLGSFFPDPRIRDFIYLQNGAAHIIKTQQPLEYFKDRWPGQGDKVKEDNASEDSNIFWRDDVSLQGFNTDRSVMNGAEMKTAGLIEYWYRGKPKMMTKEDKQLFKEMAVEKLQEGKDPSECLAKAKGTMKGIHCVYITTNGVFLEHKSYIYDHGQYPFVARTLFPEEDSIWGKGYMRDMMSPQIMLNKFAEIAVETMAKQGNGGIVYDENAITKPEKWKMQRSTPGAMLPIADINGFKELQGVNVSQTVFNMMGYYKEMLQKIPGQFDSSNGAANPNITSGAQAQALINASSGRLSLPADIIQDALEEVFMQYIELMAQFYTVERIGRIIGKDVGMSRDKLVNMAPTDYEDNQVLEEYVPQFDISVNISVERPKDREYAIQTVFNLFKMVDPMTQMPLVDAQAVQYTIENGRMEPMSVIEARMQKEEQIKAQMQQLIQQNQQLQQQMDAMMQQMNQMQGHMQTIQNDNAQGQAEMLKQYNEAQRMQFDQQKEAQNTAHQQMMDRRKMANEETKTFLQGASVMNKQGQ
ncbi:portal protein [Paenibacillus rigui]|uniref:portal protein n=1 Tax=Paenibacillus rigui TaxID=554312 RepID=UPI0015C5AA3A|nr:hypothetical protein [Paenibacillus rigui]